MDGVLRKKCQWWYWLGWMLVAGLASTRQITYLPWAIIHALLLASLMTMIFANSTSHVHPIGENDYQKKEYFFFRGCTRGAILSVVFSLLFWAIRAIFT
jgi:hypothetical protein